MIQQPSPQWPSPSDTAAFLLEGRSFALLCVVLIAILVGGGFGLRWLGKLLREHLLEDQSSKKVMSENLSKQTLQLELQTELLQNMHTDQRQHAVVQVDAAKTLTAKVDDLRLDVVKALGKAS